MTNLEGRTTPGYRQQLALAAGGAVLSVISLFTTLEVRNDIIALNECEEPTGNVVLNWAARPIAELAIKADGLIALTPPEICQEMEQQVGEMNPIIAAEQQA